MRKTLIAIVGPVGVGKSTVIVLLSNSLKRKDIFIVTTYLKAFHGLSFIVWKLMSKIVLSSQRTLSLQYARSPWYTISKLNEKLAWRLTLLTVLIDALFSIPLKLLYIHVLRLLGYTVLCEEYLYGTLMDYMYMFINAKTFRRRKILGFIIKMLISELLKLKPSVTVVLDSKISELFNRWKKRGYGDPQLRYVMFQKAFLNDLVTGRLLPISNFKVFYVDTSKLNESATLKAVIEMCQKLFLN